MDYETYLNILSWLHTASLREKCINITPGDLDAERKAIAYLKDAQVLRAGIISEKTMLAFKAYQPIAERKMRRDLVDARNNLTRNPANHQAEAWISHIEEDEF